jgi:hypothetical protein
MIFIDFLSYNVRSESRCTVRAASAEILATRALVVIFLLSQLFDSFATLEAQIDVVDHRGADHTANESVSGHVVSVRAKFRVPIAACIVSCNESAV